MARQITELLIDDIDGGNASVSVQFAYEGKTYEIDLNKRNAKKFDDAIKPWITAARRVTARTGTARKSDVDGIGPGLPGAGPGMGQGERPRGVGSRADCAADPGRVQGRELTLSHWPSSARMAGSGARNTFR